MFCSRCGSEVSSKSKFCPSCGLDLTATTPVHALATGSVAELDLVREALSSEYEILEELGRGGMALVFRAKDRHLEREVAVKVLPFSLAFDAEFVERFQREARTAAPLPRGLPTSASDPTSHPTRRSRFGSSARRRSRVFRRLHSG